ncbi:MAG: hypothetical protein IMW93_07470 [Thermoanaerobacteraceae bacterium]|uniref:Addiction module protein n=1 Tax=Desulfofundulus thermobenzoicus TaxID=29376 RepID=A0A6N7IPM8_9FIRM|nr:hypothetical protein [Desulfofundulus thermobenzoicus]MBE3588377.1 hypothetical protein [Thermoanaerobacteraceae bacterium]MQL51964.1 hypothetical protein [Desulfofundulus thermobenzoicus]
MMEPSLKEIQRAIIRLDRNSQLDLAYWILHMEEKYFDLSETPDDLRSIRRGLDDLDRGNILTSEQARKRLLKTAKT